MRSIQYSASKWFQLLLLEIPWRRCPSHATRLLQMARHSGNSCCQQRSCRRWQPSQLLPDLADTPSSLALVDKTTTVIYVKNEHWVCYEGRSHAPERNAPCAVAGCVTEVASPASTSLPVFARRAAIAATLSVAFAAVSAGIPVGADREATAGRH